LRYPDKPKVAHIGWHYYDRLEMYKNRGVTIQERIAELRKMLPKVKLGDRYAKDFEAYG